MRLSFIFVLVLLTSARLGAQAPFTEKQYAWRVETDLVYGTALNYLGQTDTLRLDLYKPLNTQTARPLLVLAHGGAWLSGCKEDMRWLCEEMAARGYVVATVNYRKGWHKEEYVPTPINPAVFQDGNCLYPADSLEIIRAIYRGQQDLKGAIRWLKQRVNADSTCNHAVLVGGESAGAFLALAAGLLDRPEEKPDACGLLPDAPNPGANLSNCFAVDCAMQTQPVPAGIALARPDLGSVDGDMNLNGYNADVTGIISFFGGVPSQAFADDWLKGPDTPAFYLYHRSCDGIVPFNFGKPFFTISAYCNLGFTPWHYNFPFINGNGSIANILALMSAPPPYQTDFLNCPPFNSNLAIFECLRYNDNGSYHYPHNRPERAGRIADFFSPLVSAKLFSQPCLVSAREPDWASGMRLSPNPCADAPRLLCDQPGSGPVVLRLLDGQGRLLIERRQFLNDGPNEVPWVQHRGPGLYYLQVVGGDGVAVLKLIRL